MAGTVLIVDDSPTLRRVTAMMLERGGYRVVVAASLGQASEVLRDSGPLEAALIDIVLPDGDGVELGRQLRADVARAGLGLVMMSASAGRLQRAADVIDGVATLAKPFDGASLRARMGESIQQARQPASARPAPRPASSRGAPVSRPPPSRRAAPASERPSTSAPPATVLSGADSPPPPIVLWEEPGAELSPAPPVASAPASIAPPVSPSVVPVALGATPTLSSDANQAALVTGVIDPEVLLRATLAVLTQLGADGWFHEQQVRDAVMATLDPSVEPPAVSLWPGTGPASVPPPPSKSTPPPSMGRPQSSGPREVLRGQADAVPLGEMLQVLQMQMQSGQVRVTRAEGEEVRIYLRQGLVDLVTARGASGEFLMGRYLLEEGLVDRDALDEALEASRAVGRRLGDELIARNLLSREQLEAALTRQSSELIYEVLRWTGARYVFVRDTGSRSDIELGLPVASLVMEGFQRVDEWRLIEEQIQPEMVLMRDEVAIDRMGAKRIGAREKTLLDAVDGHRSVRDILAATSASSFEGSKILYQFMQSRLVRRRAA